MNSAKAVIYLGALRIEYDTPADPHDYQVLIKKTWTVSRLNLAASMEGWEQKDCLPFAEDGADGHQYCGLVHMPTGEKIRFGQQKTGRGGHWYVRSKADPHYRGPESYLKAEDFAGPALPPASDMRQLEQRKEASRKQPVQAALDSGSPANDKQKKALGKLTTRVLGFDDWGFSDQTQLFDSLGFMDINKITETEAAALIAALNTKLSK